MHKKLCSVIVAVTLWGSKVFFCISSVVMSDYICNNINFSQLKARFSKDKKWRKIKDALSKSKSDTLQSENLINTKFYV